MSIELKQVFSGERLMEIHALYETAFPAGEKKPFSMIISGQETGLVEILSAEENDTFLGLAIMAKSGDRVLLDYFAIASERRGQGTGSAVLQALKERYQGMRIIIEIESTKCVDEEELVIRTISISGERRWRCFPTGFPAPTKNILISIQWHSEHRYQTGSTFWGKHRLHLSSDSTRKRFPRNYGSISQNVHRGML